MQNENGLYEVPAERLLYTHERLGAARDLGQAQVVSTFWGRAKVRIVHADDGRSGWVWVLAVLVAAGAGAALWFWLTNAHTGGADTQPVAEPPAQAVPAPNAAGPNAAAPGSPSNTPALNAPAPNIPVLTNPVQNAPLQDQPAAGTAPQQPAKPKPEQAAAGQPGAEPAAAGNKAATPERRSRRQPAESGAQPGHEAETSQADDAATAVAVPRKPAGPQPTLQITNTTPGANAAPQAAAPKPAPAKPAPAKPAPDTTSAAPAADSSPQPEGTGTQP